MNKPDKQDDIDWSLTTWEGSRMEQYRRWSQLTLREILLAQEEMQEQADCFHNSSSEPASPE